MKAFLFLLLLAVGGYFGYRYFTDAPPPAKRLAPEGVYFTTERFSEKIDFGVRALKAASRVKLLSKEGDNSFVADDQGNKFTVPSRILTNDLDVRDALLKTLTGQQDKARQSAKANATVTNQVRESRAKKMQDDIVHLNLRIEELTMARSRAQEELEAESKKKTASGDSLMGVERVRGAIAQIDSQIKIAQRKIEDTQMAIKKEQLGQ